MSGSLKAIKKKFLLWEKGREIAKQKDKGKGKFNCVHSNADEGVEADTEASSHDISRGEARVSSHREMLDILVIRRVFGLLDSEGMEEGEECIPPCIHCPMSILD